MLYEVITNVSHQNCSPIAGVTPTAGLGSGLPGAAVAVVLGHSAGAMTAALLGADYPERFRGVILTGHSFSGDPTQMLPFLPGVGEIWAARQTIIGDAFSNRYLGKAEAVHRIRGTRAAYLAFMRSQYYRDTSYNFV